MRYLLSIALLLFASATTFGESPFEKHGRLRVAKSGTHLEHADGTPFFVLADTCWTGPALSTEADWAFYLADRKKKGFTAIQFCMIAPWSAAPADAEGNVSCKIVGDTIEINEAYYKRVDARLKAINDSGLLAMPVLCWALRPKVDLGMMLTTEQATKLCAFEVNRYKDAHTLWILAGDNRYDKVETAKWQAVGRAVFKNHPSALVTTHPTGMNWPWKGWENEKWLNVLGYQSGHGDDAKTWAWIHNGPPAQYGVWKSLSSTGKLDFLREKSVPPPAIRRGSPLHETEQALLAIEKEIENAEKTNVDVTTLKLRREAIVVTMKLQSASASRPVMNLEPPYEGHDGYQSKKPHSDFNVRRASYWSLLVHPPMGVTYGGHGVWSWHLKPGEHPTGHQGTGPAKLWKDSLDLPGATQMGYARKLFEKVGFANLRPANVILAEQPGDKDDGQFVACAATSDLKTIVIYSPSGKIALKPGVIPAGSTKNWFDPRTGETHPADAEKLSPPGDGDWVLVITP